VIREHSEQSPRQTRVFFGSLFLLGYALPDPAKVIAMGEAIAERFETDPTIFAMLGGAFLPPNCRFEFMFNGLARSILTRSQEAIKGGRIEIVLPVLKLVILLVRQRALRDFPVMCSFVVTFAKSILSLLDAILAFLNNLESADLNLLKCLSCLFLILAGLINCPCFNFGLFRLYDDPCFDNLLTGVFDICFRISFDCFLSIPKFGKRYLLFIGTLLRENLTLFLQQSEVVVGHHVHLLLTIVKHDSRELAIKGAKTLLILFRETDSSDLQPLRDSLQSSFFTAVKMLMTLVFVAEVKERTMIALLKVLASIFPDEREQLLRTLIGRFPPVSQREADIHATAFLSALTDGDSELAFARLWDAVRAIIAFARTAGVELSFD
jgi:hypothetical protein